MSRKCFSLNLAYLRSFLKISIVKISSPFFEVYNEPVRQIALDSQRFGANTFRLYGGHERQLRLRDGLLRERLYMLRSERRIAEYKRESVNKSIAQLKAADDLNNSLEQLELESLAWQKQIFRVIGEILKVEEERVRIRLTWLNGELWDFCNLKWFAINSGLGKYCSFFRLTLQTIRSLKTQRVT